ncbi:phage major capsid protein [Congregibacter litoralis]|uniref:Phage major capsid protein, HK97 family n=1 Tax=Congregibacter litoralis KT71 TaxID=314285 RepID=A4ACG5_9GAMM|nr:phage major capsid protein [Congregibacter litoralis]EAQ96393.1 phage major capsid protein, HK97 family [Congregibacter litoralis KT71]
MTPEFKNWRERFLKRYAQFEPRADDTDTKIIYRYAEFETDRIQRASDDQQTVHAILSTETPVQRRHYREVLQHTAEAVDLSRAENGGGFPLLWAHKQDDQIGIAENVSVHGGALRARLRFSKSARGQEIWRDVKAGILKGVSIGAEIVERSFSEDRDDPTSTVTRWMPFECSLVAIPADINAKIGRAMDLGLIDDKPDDIRLMDAQRTMLRNYDMLLWVAEDGEDSVESTAPAFATFEQRMMAARSVSDIEGLNTELDALGDLVDDANSDGEISTVRSETTGTDQGHWHRPNFLSKSKIMKPAEFSLCRALAAQIDNKVARAASRDLDALDAYGESVGAKRDARGTLVPEALIFRALDKATEGTDLIGMSHRPDLFIEALRSRLVTGVMGATILQGLTSDIQIPRKTADSVAGWIAGDGSDAVSQSTPTFDKITMRSKTVGAQCVISRKMLIQAEPASELVVRDTLSHAVAQALDVAALAGSGTGNSPRGILNTANIGSETYANGGEPGFVEIVAMEGALMAANSDMGNLGYVSNGVIASQLKRTDIGTDTGRMVWTSNGEAQGILNGYRAMVSNNVPAGNVIFANWSDLVIGMWSGVDLVVDQTTRAAYGDVIITAMMDCDIAVRHPESFVKLSEAA